MIRSRPSRFAVALIFAALVAGGVGMPTSVAAHGAGRGGGDRGGGGHGGGDRGGGDHGGGDHGGGDHGGGDHGGGDRGEGTGRSEKNDDGRSARTQTEMLAGRFGVSALGDLSFTDAVEARAALALGRIRPLTQVLGVARRAADGRVLEVELKRGAREGWLYEVTVLARDGRYFEIEIDAGDATLRRLRRR